MSLARDYVRTLRTLLGPTGRDGVLTVRRRGAEYLVALHLEGDATPIVESIVRPVARRVQRAEQLGLLDPPPSEPAAAPPSEPVAAPPSEPPGKVVAHRKQPEPGADRLKVHGAHALVMRAGEGAPWKRVLSRREGESATAWDKRVEAYATPGVIGAGAARLYNGGGRCTWDSRDGGAP